ncbi:MAG TPA: aminotransferase class V-fold PLP-dependent enzyme [Candidatus Binatia bacterium]|nr:aminotransferase class V-fold PLP-dependent enzyme [Candidatus Binatia bacterium]
MIRGDEGIPAGGAALAEVLRSLHGEVRRQFPARERDITGGRRVYLNSAGGTLVAERSARAMEEAALRANAQDGAVGSGERATAEIHARARRAAAAFLNAPSPDEISFHQSTSHALFNLSFAFRDLLGRGSNLVVTRLDHAANVTPWESIWGEDCGLEVRECGVRRDGTLDLDEMERLIDRRTRLVAVTCASNGLGTVVPVDEVARLARRHGRPEPPRGAARQTRGAWRGALVVVDAVHHACHGPLDVGAMDCDFLAFSGYKVFGPIVGVLWGRKRWLDALRPYRVEANEDRTPVKFEQGTPNHAVLAGLSAALDYLDALGGRIESAADGQADLRAMSARLAALYPDRDRRRLKWAMCAVRDYEQALTKAALLGFSALAKRGVRLHGIADPERAPERDPTFLFEVSGRTQMEVKRRLWEDGKIEVPDGNYYSLAVYRALKSRRTVRASFAHYDGLDTVRHFLDSLARITEG